MNPAKDTYTIILEMVVGGSYHWRIRKEGCNALRAAGTGINRHVAMEAVRAALLNEVSEEDSDE